MLGNAVSMKLMLTAVVASIALVGCGHQYNDMGNMMGSSWGSMGTGSGQMYGMGPAAFSSIYPMGGAEGVPVSTGINLRFSMPMGPGTGQLVDLHSGGLSGPVVPWTCGWSADGTALNCTPTSPLEPGTLYTVHMGGGMVDSNGQPLGGWQYGAGMGGAWVMGSMMGAYHAGSSWGHMGPGWLHPTNGSYGMAFTFTTG